MHDEACKSGSAIRLGVYDSGSGGLSVLRQLRSLRPDLDVIYVADTARVPYGGRPAQDILRFNREMASGLAALGATHLVVACNTSCALAVPTVRMEQRLPMIGLLEAGARAATAAGRRIGILATESTIRSGAYGQAVRAARADAEVFELACTEWVPLVEDGVLSGPEAKKRVRSALSPWLRLPALDAVILGCTHFPFLASLVEEALPGGPLLVDPAPLAAKAICDLLPAVEGKAGLLEFWSSGPQEEFLASIRRLVPDLAPTHVLPWPPCEVPAAEGTALTLPSSSRRP
ncbi:MAG: glutamate racemase [Candidatus Sericytochromatia bacterium]|nr:glutamate racemase [Candidatus Sericytochromatia bacterium]